MISEQSSSDASAYDGSDASDDTGSGSDFGGGDDSDEGDDWDELERKAAKCMSRSSLIWRSVLTHSA